jgi:hypothetical protein
MDSISERRVQQVELMRTCGGDDRSIGRRAEHAIAFEDLELDWRRDTDASRTLPGARLVDCRDRTGIG